MKKSFVVKCCGALTLLLVFITGCGAAGESDPATPETASPSPAPRQEETVVYNLLEEKWAEECTDADALPWNMSDFLEVAFPHQWNAEWCSTHSAVDGSCYHILQGMYTQQEGESTRTLYWIVTDAASGESVTEQWELQAAPDASGEEAALMEVFKDPSVSIAGIDVSGGKRYLFFQQNEDKGPRYEDKEPIHYYRVRTDSEGHVEEVLDLLPALREGNFLSQTGIMLPGGYCDSAGRCYVSDAMGRVGVID